MIKPLQKHTIVDEIINALFQMIDSGYFKPGQRMPSERELSLKLNVSRTSIREALKSLSFVKLVTIKPGDGTYLTQDEELLLSIREKYSPNIMIKGITFRQAYESRLIFEPEISKLAAERATPENIKALKASITAMQKCIDEDSMLDYHIEDLKFHELVAESTQNPLLIHQASLCMQDLSENKPTLGQAKNVLNQHRTIYEAIRNNQPEEAKKAALNHLYTVGVDMELPNLFVTQQQTEAETGEQ